MTTPILILGDAPNLPTGLARIARDLATHLHASSVDVEVAQLGLDYDGTPYPWRVYPVLDRENWAQNDLERVWAWHARGRPGVLLTVWDPARCVGTAGVDFIGSRWGYFAVDGNNPDGKIGGPAAHALRRYHRVLAYTDYGARVLKKTLGAGKVQWLPHGINSGVFQAQPIIPRLLKTSTLSAIQKWDASGPELALGCVATNQARKDLSLVFELAHLLGARLWISTDKLVAPAWSIAELADIYDINDDRLLVTLELTDAELAYLYGACDVTIAPGLGEGFGYPIVESLACGTPVVHVDYAGGAEHTPKAFRLEKLAVMRREGCYVIERPIVLVGAAMDVIQKIVARLKDPDQARELRAYCTGSVAHLDWNYLWPRWRSWFQAGLDEFTHEGDPITLPSRASGAPRRPIPKQTVEEESIQ